MTKQVKNKENVKLSSEEVAKAYKILSENIRKFVLVFCKEAVEGTIPGFHRDLYELLEGNEDLVIAAPRGFAKSTLVSKFYPLWLALFKHRRDICIISNSEGLAVEHLRWIKQKCESDGKLIASFGNLKSEKWTENHIILQHADGTRVNIRARGAGGQIRGFRPDCVICDDLETDDSVASEEQTKKLKDWVFKACYNTLLPGGRFLVIGTVLHPLSLLSDLLETDNGFTKRRLTAYINGVEEEGSELWPDQRPHSWLQERKATIGSFRFAAEYMNDPVSDEAAPIKPDQVRIWENLPSNLSHVIAVDPAYSEDSKADYKVASLVGITPEYRRYLCHYIRTHQPQGEFIDSILNLWLQHRNTITGVGIPNSGVEKSFYNSFLKRAEERHLSPPVIPLTNTFQSASGSNVRNKKERIIATLQPLFEQGKYFIGPNHLDAKEELIRIGSSRNDDLVDSLAYAEQILVPSFYDAQPIEDHNNVAFEYAGSYGIEY